MRIVASIFFLLVLFSSCGESPAPVEPERIVLDDIASMQSRRLGTADQDENFRAFRRLEALTRDEFDLDHLSYEFYSTLLSEDSLAKYTEFWLNWLIKNKERLTYESMHRAVDSANNNISLTLPDEPNMVKLRVKNGIDSADTSKDEILRAKYLENLSNLRLPLLPAQ